MEQPKIIAAFKDDLYHTLIGKLYYGMNREREKCALFEVFSLDFIGGSTAIDSGVKIKSVAGTDDRTYVRSLWYKKSRGW